jgi:hypothetical protein
VDLSRARVVLRQRSTLDVMDLALRFIVANAALYAKVTAIAIVPFALVTWGVAWSAGWAWAWTATVLLALLVETPFTVLASRLVFEKDVRIRGVLGASLRALPRLFLVRAVQVLAVVTGMFFLVFPGIWLAVIFMFVVEATILERSKWTAAFARSRTLALGKSAQAITAGMLLLLLSAAAAVLGDDVGRFGITSLFQFHEPEALWTAGGSPMALFGFWLFVPYAATARFFVYLDLRTRSEGWDIQTRFAAIALRGSDHQRAAA